MKYKTKKLLDLEKKRYSILTEDLETCYLCRSPKQDIHEIFGGSNRKVSMQHGFCVPLCRYHHRILTDNPNENFLLKQTCQKVYEFKHTRKEFIDIIGRNYL